jgi:hypothetical protein
MSDDMVIPDDVRAEFDSLWESWRADEALAVIARWARDEALKPFRKAEKAWRQTPITGRWPNDRDWPRADIRLRHAVFAALRSGTADTNPKEDR